ncbi:membrane-bound serine protease (ClpP class) [Schinkia azotoformans MEV2011]|uniref:Membrane-bound serine protease (ClpP class) n=1 Tax=Schinkia azotoformans MEV2011 TaxID=1348973 RepID=A0A072NL28_SCHAZ|nr:nodulation protein NfeD [Schinkia azotoformans]KEF38136.1 membrane-bound serine protease (ClpP class) [Schinkia azotoformans MEV2011]MEC1696697.1 nodulation protein NfeD [Schinkia azotoformans]MEC1716451.1 nodulation protein NfeD [Schinkia azotoformans]MEC1726171.1 nodulation protein NfeD [Schinkia azotoformans]MEC1743488.1 nodulation protein NfeD [Schinkia azotoformans]
MRSKTFIQKAIIITFALFTLFILLPQVFPVQAKSEKIVYFVPVEKTVEQGLGAFLNRSIEEAEKIGASHIVFELNTPGGVVDAALDIAKSLRETEIPTTAFINKSALSAGAYLALNADQIVMVPHSTMGAAGIIDQQGNTAGKKAESMWLAEMKASAELNNRDPIYALAMADENVEIPKFGVKKGEFLTLTAEQAIEVGYAEKIVSTRAELLDYLELSGATIQQMEESFAEKLARFITNPIVVPILLSIGSLGLVIELYSPGFGVPGIMGLSSLLLFFYGHMIAGLAGMESIILVIIGIILIVLEFFVPGGIMGLLGVLSIITSLLLAAENISHMIFSILIAILVTIIASVILFRRFGYEKGIFKRIILFDSTSSEQGYVSNQNRLDLIGLEGTTVTPLRPSGTAVFNDERVDVVTEGSFISSNIKVKIIKVEGSRIVVREIKKEVEE